MALILLVGLAVGCGDSAGGNKPGEGKDGGSQDRDSGSDGRDASLVPPGDGGTLVCSAGTADCDANSGNGCEADLTSVEHCGACDNACSAGPHANVSCNNNQCVMTTCDSGFADCDNEDANGCETDLNGKTNCGSCGNDCGLGDCMSGSCTVPSCDTANTLTNDCDGDATNGCETSVATLTDCGNCNVPCDLANASETCSTGSCAITTCDADFDDCNEDPEDGCEQSLKTTAHCTACDVACGFTNSASDCSTGTCLPGLCAVNFDDCNDDLPTDGCETLLTTVDDCGACDTLCDMAHASENCSTGVCTFTGCDTNFVDANQDSGSPTSDGCECEDILDHASCGAALHLDADGNSATHVGIAVGNNINQGGVIATQGGEDWYEVTLTDSNRAARALSISLTNDAGGIYKFDIVDDCVGGGDAYTCKTGSVNSSSLSSYSFGDLCSGGAGGCNTDSTPSGLPVGATGVPFATQRPTVYLIKVRRTTAGFTCLPYTLNITRT
jgi:hypothetical protein